MAVIDRSGAELKLSTYIVASNSLTDFDAGMSQRVLFSTRSGVCLVIPERTWDFLLNGTIRSLPPELLSRLIEAKVLVDADENELNTIIQENKEQIVVDSTLYQVVQPTAWCQLDCGYCGQEHTRKKLSSGSYEHFVQRVGTRLKSGDYRKLEVSWFGAEPTIEMPVIRDLTPKLLDTAQSHGCGYSASIVTNGLTLTRQLANELYDKHYIKKAEITLDGMAEFHDKRRMTKKGHHTFETIFKNLIVVAKETPLSIVLRCNVDAHNIDGVAPLIELLAQEELQNTISFYTVQVHSWNNDAHLDSLSKEKYSEMELEWIALQIRLGFNVGLLPPRKKIVCMAVRRDSEMIDANDFSYNCTEVSYTPGYGNPNEYATRLPGTNEVVDTKKSRRLRDFNEKVISGEREQCNSCRMLPVCGGQCPKAWEDGYPPCPSPKYNMPQRLDLLYAVNKLNIH